MDKRTNHRMKAVYNQANQMWAVKRGDAFVGIGPGDVYFFITRKQLKRELGKYGLTINAANTVRLQEQELSFAQ